MAFNSSGLDSGRESVPNSADVAARCRAGRWSRLLRRNAWGIPKCRRCCILILCGPRLLCSSRGAGDEARAQHSRRRKDKSQQSPRHCVNLLAKIAAGRKLKLCCATALWSARPWTSGVNARLRGLFGMPLFGRIRRLRRVDLRPKYSWDPRAQCLAVRKHNLHDTPNRRAILDRLQSDGNVIAGLEDLPAPAEIGHVRWIARFGNPMGDIAFVIRRVEFQPAMGICPNPFRDRRLHVELLINIKIRVAMMSKKRGSDQQSQSQKNDDVLSLHARPPVRWSLPRGSAAMAYCRRALTIVQLQL